MFAQLWVTDLVEVLGMQWQASQPPLRDLTCRGWEGTWFPISYACAQCCVPASCGRGTSAHISLHLPEPHTWWAYEVKWTRSQDHVREDPYHYFSGYAINTTHVHMHTHTRCVEEWTAPSPVPIAYRSCEFSKHLLCAWITGGGSPVIKCLLPNNPISICVCIDDFLCVMHWAGSILLNMR